MADPRNFRISDAENPDRLEDFEAALKKAGQQPAHVIRMLAEAYIRYVTQHGHAPSYPVQIVPFEAPKALPAAAAKTKRKKKAK